VFNRVVFRKRNLERIARFWVGEVELTLLDFNFQTGPSKYGEWIDLTNGNGGHFNVTVLIGNRKVFSLKSDNYLS